MNASSDAAEQVVRMSLNGVEMALRVTGKGAPKAAALIYRALKTVKNESAKTKGAIRLANLARSGKKLDVTEIMDTDLKKFCVEAKKYGILYTILKDRNRTDGLTEIMYKSEDKEKLGLVFEKLNMATYDTAEVQHEISQDLQSQPPPEKTGREISDPDQFLEELMKKPEVSLKPEVAQGQNPLEARTKKRDRSEPDSRDSRMLVTRESTDRDLSGGRRSVRKELTEIKDEMERESDRKSPKSRTKQPLTAEHKDPGKKKKKKSKER